MDIKGVVLRLCACGLLAHPALASVSDPSTSPHGCENAPAIGKFQLSRDLLIANFDSRPDVDDLQAVAALGTVLRDPKFTCVDYVATAGAYGTQSGAFIPAERLFDLSFGDNWIDAHADRDAVVQRLVEKASSTLLAGGSVWVTEAGQSDVTASVLRSIPEELRARFHVVQHSDWNESVTTREDFDFVKTRARYHRISDGNYPGNGTPAFNTSDNRYWRALLDDPRVGAIWAEARRLSDKHNPVAEYVNPAVAAGGMDFSDAVEVAYVFGFDEMEGVGDFVSRFVHGN